MKNFTMLRLLVVGAALALVLGAAACDSDNSKLTSTNNSSSTDSGTNNGEGEGDDSYAGDDDHNGQEPWEIEHIEPGFMNGSWRAGALDQDKPVAYFDTFQDEGEPETTGTFVMGNAIYDGGVDGESGDIKQGSFEGDTLTLKWNPTTDPDEMFTLVATRADENTLNGKVTSKRNPELDMSVAITRKLAE